MGGEVRTAVAVPRCHYCGDVATTRDHVRPRSLTSIGAQEQIPTVPACRDCNCKILRSLPLFTDAERGARVAAVLGGRLMKMGPSKWTEDEAEEELTGSLRRKIVSSIRKYNLTKSRHEFSVTRWVRDGM